MTKERMLEITGEIVNRSSYTYMTNFNKYDNDIATVFIDDKTIDTVGTWIAITMQTTTEERLKELLINAIMLIQAKKYVENDCKVLKELYYDANKLKDINKEQVFILQPRNCYKTIKKYYHGLLVSLGDRVHLELKCQQVIGKIIDMSSDNITIDRPTTTYTIKDVDILEIRILK